MDIVRVKEIGKWIFQGEGAQMTDIARVKEI